MTPIVRAVVLLARSNVFMTFAWYAHLRHLSRRAWNVAAFVSWGIARCIVAAVYLSFRSPTPAHG